MKFTKLLSWLPVFLTICVSLPSRAAEVLAKRFDAPSNGNLFAGNLREWGGDGTNIARAWAPGFRTVSTGTTCFVTGWADQADSIDDGFITRLDSSGGILWTKRMQDIFGFRMRINDAEVDATRLYVCGQDQNNRAFVACLTHDGTAVDYSLITGTNLGILGYSADARATSLELTTINGTRILTVGGDAVDRGLPFASGLFVRQRNLTAPADVFPDLKLFQNKRDNFVVQFDTNLQATWGTTLGFPWGDDFVTAVTADPTGAVFVASVFSRNVDPGASFYREFDNMNGGINGTARRVHSGSSSGNLSERDDIHNQTYTDRDFWPGNFAILWRISANDGLNARITHYMSVNNIFGSAEADSEGRITDITYQNGAIYAAGEWRKFLRPGSRLEDGLGKFRLESAKSGADYTWDIWTARLNANNLDATAWQIFRSPGEDFVTQLATSADGVYLAGVAGGSMETFKNYITTNDGVLDPSNSSAAKAQLGGSSSQHLFWQKLAENDLTPGWHLKPEEGDGASIPGVQKFAGITQTDGKVIITGGWQNGTLSLGPLGKRVNLPDASRWRGFAGFLKSDGTWLEQVVITINSAYGTPSPHKGTNTVAGGVTITASVPPEIYEAAGGVVLNSQDTEAIRTRAVTRRVCTGYQFRNSTTNGTANTVTFVASGDVELSFLWRTEHAVEIESDLSGTAGLTSTAAGNPDPPVQKHWVVENSQITAFIDGATGDIAVPGIRWRSAGFVPYGCVASAQGVPSGWLYHWPAYQPRQQTAKITVGAPGRIVWKWEKEYSVRVAANSIVASNSPYVDAPARMVFASAVSGFPAETILYEGSYANDGFLTKYLNFTKSNVGVVLGYAGGIQANVLMLTTADDEPARDPATVRVEGRNAGGAWATLANSITIPSVGRYVTQYFSFANNTTYDEYKLTVLTIANEAAANSMQVAELRLGTATRYTGSGEFWAAPGSVITAGAPATVSSGISSLALKGYTGGQGSVAPYTTAGVTQKTFILNEPSSITWDYARAIYPETVAIGSSITFSGVTGVDATNANRIKAPLGGSVSLAPSGSSWGDMQQWDDVAKKLVILRPGKFTVEFENAAAANDAAQNVIVEVNAIWPAPHYNHILEAPPVNLDESATDFVAFQRVAFTEGTGKVGGTLFSTTEPGRSVLVFSERTSRAATGNLALEKLRVRVVDSQRWLDAAPAIRTSVQIGNAITTADHDSNAVGHNGYVLNPLAPVNASAYNRESLAGPIIPVNEEFPAVGRWASSQVPDTLNGLIARLPLNETTGSTAAELVSGEQVNFFSSVPPPQWTNPAVRIYRNYSEYFKTSADIGRGVTNRLTLSAWINPVSFVDWGGIVTKGVEQAPYTFATWSDGRLTFGANEFSPAGGSGGGFTPWMSQGTVPTNQWSHVAVTYDGLAVRFYINGALDSEQPASITFGSVNEPLVIGADLPGGDEFFDGSLKDVRVYDRALGAGQIGSLAEKSRPQAGALPIAWYQVQENIRWPYKANTYGPQWPVSAGRIVTASRLGSEGMNGAATVDGPGGSLTYSSSINAGSPVWTRPNQDRLSVSSVQAKYNVVAVVPTDDNNATWVVSLGWNSLAFLYEGEFDPAKPLQNLIGSMSVNGTWAFLSSLRSGRLYHIVMTQNAPGDPIGALSVDLQGGAQLPIFQDRFVGASFSEPIIYHQPEPDALGYNPNEEHSLVAPSFLDPARPAAFALRADINRTALDASFTSKPYTLVQYTDRSDPANPVVKMAAYSVADEDSSILDLRLPAFNQRYTYFYQGEAGQKLVPPYPLERVIGPSASPEESNAENVDGRIAYHEDKAHNAWIVSGDTDVAEDIRAEFYYPLRADFWHPTLEVGQVIPLGHLPAASPIRDILYNTIWPADVAVLKAGETLTFSGGEYAGDNNDLTPRPKGLPGAVAWQCARLLFDSANSTMSPIFMDSKYLGRVFPALEARKVPLALTALPDDLKPASGNVIVEGLLWRFKKLPASLQKRVYYDSSSQKICVRGYLNDKTLGDGDLLATPGAQTILQPNVLTVEDQAILTDLSSSSYWTSAVNALGGLSRNPLGAPVTGSLGIGLEPANGGAGQATNFGLGLAVITNPDLQNPATSSTLPDGYITFAENDDPALGDAPVAIHVIRISRNKYRGSIAVIAPENAFDEKLNLRHTADFGGDVADLYFEWVYREEDGRDLNPPNVVLPTVGTPTAADWTVFSGGGLGKSEIQMSGASAAMLTDNVFYCRYRHKDGNEWSTWAGAANSREPKPASPSAATDIAYVAQLAPGWIKRVTNAVNQFDARIRDFRNNDAPATYTSMIQQAGQRWEGPVAFNPQKDAIENYGLIELYQTVLDRGKDLSINLAPGTDGVNTALLNAANRIAGFYTLLGNEAYADSLDPTVGYSTVGGQFGNLAPTIHCFQNQTGSLLEEELALLRGRGEVGARPAYNRLIWNFTNGQGEAAYALNYAIGDLNNDGFINEVDARRLYPQGHGDAWGHYTMALKGYYDLAKLSNFTWSSRSEKYNIDGVVLDVDYLDERMFAKSAAARAQCGAAMVDLVYRQAYTESPGGQWQGYQDVNTDRAWGVYETSQRAGTAAFCDWLMANALLKGEETDTAKTGIRKVDRTTVGELRLIAQQASAIQAKLDSADRGMNPSGLDPEAVPFDIDPVLADRTNPNASTHFEQIYQRAVGAGKNALLAFNSASDLSLQLRRTAASTEGLRQQTVDEDRSLRNQLIEIFGTPYEGQIGAGKAYPSGYKGPDLYLFMYMDRVSVGDGVLPELDNDIVATTIVPGLRNLATDTNPFQVGGAGVPDLLKDTVSTYFPADVPLPTATGTPITINLPRQASGYALVAPDGWGARRSPGAIQAAVQDLIHAEWKLRMAIDAYEGTSDDFKLLLRKFELKSGIAAEKLRVAAYAEDRQDLWHNVATSAFASSTVLDNIREVVSLLADGFHEAFPRVVGLDNDATSSARALVKMVHAASDATLRAGIAPLQILQYRAELEADEAMVEMDQALLTEDLKSEIVDLLAEIQQLVNDEGDLRVAVIDAVETMRAASERVRTVTEKGLALIEERTVFNQRVAATTTKMRYEDYTFRVFHTEALRKYQSSFDLAARYAYLAGKAYQFELNLPDNHPANASPLLAEMLRTRTLGVWDAGQPVLGQGGIAEQIATMKTNFDTLKGQLGFNNPATEVNSFSVRAELARIGLSSRVNAAWRSQLETYRVPDLWNYQYQNSGVNYGYVFRRYCRPFAPESAGAQPGLVIPFSSQIAAGKNWFGLNLAGGDSSFNASNFSTKIRAAGIRLDGFNNTAMSQTPQVYFVPVGADRMFLPNSSTLADRSWNVVDQRIPAPLAISQANLNDPDWMPYTGSGSGFFEEVRKFSSFRAYHDAGGWSNAEMLSNGRLVGRSAWNTQWVLIIPSATLLYDGSNTSAGIDTLIYGAPMPGFNQSNAGTTNRDMVGVRDIRILLQTYSISGN